MVGKLLIVEEIPTKKGKKGTDDWATAREKERYARWCTARR